MKHYASLWLIVASALAIFIVISFCDDIVLGDWHVKKAPFEDAIFADNDSVSGIADNSPMENDSVAVEMQTDSVPKSILIFGDSMTFNLALRLAQYAKQNGHKIHSVNWD